MVCAPTGESALMNDVLSFLAKKTGSVLAGIFVIVIILQIMFGFVLDLATDMIFLGLLMGSTKLNALAEWWQTKK